MEIKHSLGLPMAFAEVAEALETDWTAYRDRVDVVRVVDPPQESWSALTEAGFLVKPSWLTWIADTRADEQAYLATLRRKDRWSLKDARRHVEAAGQTISVEKLTAELLDSFLDLYQRQLAAMRNALPIAVQQRDQLLEEADEFFAVCAWEGDRLAGASLNECQAEGDLVRIRFSAVDEAGRRNSLARVLYTEAAGEARARGLGRISAGNDPNLYGHVVETGLFSFKSRLGFSAVPSQTVHPCRGDNSADLVLAHTRLADPALQLSYDLTATRLPGELPGLRLDLFCGPDLAEPTHHFGTFPGEVHVHRLPPGP